MTPHEDAPGPDDAAGASDEFERAEVDESTGRLWLRAIIPLLQSAAPEPDPNPRVQFAIDRMRIAACERAARILASDVAGPSA